MVDIPTRGGKCSGTLERDDQILLLRHSDLSPWLPYEEFPDYVLPDPEGFSKGIATLLSAVEKN